MKVIDSIDLLKREGSKLAKPIPVEGLPSMEFDCYFAEESVSPQEISAIIPNCPQDLLEFWNSTRNARLFTDKVYGQWGLEILEPKLSVQITEQFQQCRKRDFLIGDLIIGRFLGDSDLLLIRSDKNTSDYGTVYVVLPIDPRSDWYLVSNYFAGFLSNYIKSCGNKYWVST